jgi:hypothetical protein
MKRLLIIILFFVCSYTKAQTTSYSVVINFNKEQSKFEEPAPQVNIISIDRSGKRIRINENHSYYIQRVLDQKGIVIFDCRDSLTKEGCSIEFFDNYKVAQFEYPNRKYRLK